MSAHTPGPWRVAETTGGKRWIYSGDLRVAKAASDPLRSQRDANERLIAAAPDLLAALLFAEKFIEEDTCRHDSEKGPILSILANAILKARGGK